LEGLQLFKGHWCETALSCEATKLGSHNLPCLNGGIPSGNMGKCECYCINGYRGDNCEIDPVCTAGANGQPCLNEGKIVGNISTCAC